MTDTRSASLKPSFPKNFNFKKRESVIYDEWEKGGFFKAHVHSKKKSFTISMPPPNATGQLHLGHAARLATEDILIRYHRMIGDEALLLPGTDHAAIATESVVIKRLQDEKGMKNPRATLGRKKLVEEIITFIENSRGTIRSQVRKMGASCDWSRERYTMDQSLNRCVNEVFAKMYNDGLIYRGERIINWDPNMQTTVADDELNRKEERAPFFTFRYGPFEIGTARPETKFGDKYVVVHPDDERYAKYTHGQTFETEWINGPITATIIKDEAAVPEFGTGAMTITPWHDMTDFEIAERHYLDKQQIIDLHGKLLPVAGEFAGMPIEEARPKIVEKLKSKGLLVNIDTKYTHSVALSYRGKGLIEPQILKQWFVNVNKKVVDWKDQKMSFREVMQDVVKSGTIKIVPKRFEKIYFHWIDNLRDWCISRQIWWGHRIPVWYQGSLSNDKENSKNIFVGSQAPQDSDQKDKKTRNSKKWIQDPDTLDTWFSSALWTWSTLVDPKLTKDFTLSLQEILDKSPDYQKFHPTSVMETAYEILFFWVARMILMTTYITGQIPFHTIYLSGLIRTRDGKKMSKSDPATIIDPLDMIEQYGTDALRMSLIVGQTPGNDSRLYKEKIAGYRNFTNKLWNISRFIYASTENYDPELELKLESLGINDRWILSKLHRLIQKTTDQLQKLHLGHAAQDLQEFVKYDFADWYIETTKVSKSPQSKQILLYTLEHVLKLLHPFMPFETEDIWSYLHVPGPQSSQKKLIASSWPRPYENFLDDEAERDFALLQKTISIIRNARSEYNIPPSKKINIIIFARKSTRLLKENIEYIRKLANIADIDFLSTKKTFSETLSFVLKDAMIIIPLKGLIDIPKEIKNLEKEKNRITGFIATLEKKLQNNKFISHAPPEIVEKEKQKLLDQQQKLESIDEKLNELM